jgi:hypothetical protein
MQRRDLLVLSLKGFLAWLVLSGLAVYYGDHLAKGLFPLTKSVLIMMDPALSPSLTLLKSAQSQLDYTIELSAWVLEPIYLNADHFVPPKTELKSSAHLLHSLVPVVIEGTILLAWPVQHWPQRMLLLGLGVLSAVFVVMLTLPAQLLGSLEISFQDVAETGQNPRPVPWFVDWMIFCEMGGRWLLGIVSAWGCIRLQHRLLKDRTAICRMRLE